MKHFERQETVWDVGFLINPPLSLYYMQGLNLTPLHAHTALFGVYGLCQSKLAEGVASA